MYDAALAQEQWRTMAWIHKAWPSRRVRFWVHRTNLFNPWIHKGCTWIHKHRALSNRENTQEKKAKLSKGITSNCEFKCYNEGLIYASKSKGRPSDLTHEKRTQESWKYNSDSMHVSETEVTKAKVNLPGLVRPIQTDICSFQGMSSIFVVPRRLSDKRVRS